MEGDKSVEPTREIVPSQVEPSLEVQEKTEVKSDRDALRELWEFASVLDFFRVFRQHLQLDLDVTAEDLETALLTPVPSPLLKDIHIILLKGIQPSSRPPADHKTWATLLARRMHNNWALVAAGRCPVRPCHGEEEEAYIRVPPVYRARMLRALCELRLDQEDARATIDYLLRKGEAEFRLDPFGCSSDHQTFWLCDDPAMGHRLFKEAPAILPETEAEADALLAAQLGTFPEEAPAGGEAAEQDAVEEEGKEGGMMEDNKGATCRVINGELASQELGLSADRVEGAVERTREGDGGTMPGDVRAMEVEPARGEDGVEGAECAQEEETGGQRSPREGGVRQGLQVASQQQAAPGNRAEGKPRAEGDLDGGAGRTVQAADCAGVPESVEAEASVKAEVEDVDSVVPRKAEEEGTATRLDQQQGQMEWEESGRGEVSGEARKGNLACESAGNVKAEDEGAGEAGEAQVEGVSEGDGGESREGAQGPLQGNARDAEGGRLSESEKQEGADALPENSAQVQHETTNAATMEVAPSDQPPAEAASKVGDGATPVQAGPAESQEAPQVEAKAEAAAAPSCEAGAAAAERECAPEVEGKGEHAREGVAMGGGEDEGGASMPQKELGDGAGEPENQEKEPKSQEKEPEGQVKQPERQENEPEGQALAEVASLVTYGRKGEKRVGQGRPGEQQAAQGKQQQEECKVLGGAEDDEPLLSGLDVIQEGRRRSSEGRRRAAEAKFMGIREVHERELGWEAGEETEAEGRVTRSRRRGSAGSNADASPDKKQETPRQRQRGREEREGERGETLDEGSGQREGERRVTRSAGRHRAVVSPAKLESQSEAEEGAGGEGKEGAAGEAEAEEREAEEKPPLEPQRSTRRSSRRDVPSSPPPPLTIRTRFGGKRPDPPQQAESRKPAGRAKREEGLGGRKKRVREKKPKEPVKPRVFPPPPMPGEFRTVAVSLQEFTDLAAALCDGRNRSDRQLGERLQEEVLPQVDFAEKKRERHAKRQQRQALQLALAQALRSGDPYGLAGGRTRRERKPVTYTFDDFDRSINDAIKVTKGRELPPEAPPTREGLRSSRGRAGFTDGDAGATGEAAAAAGNGAGGGSGGEVGGGGDSQGSGDGLSGGEIAGNGGTGAGEVGRGGVQGADGGGESERRLRLRSGSVRMDEEEARAEKERRRRRRNERWDDDEEDDEENEDEDEIGLGFAEEGTEEEDEEVDDARESEEPMPGSAGGAGEGELAKREEAEKAKQVFIESHRELFGEEEGAETDAAQGSLAGDGARVPGATLGRPEEGRGAGRGEEQSNGVVPSQEAAEAASLRGTDSEGREGQSEAALEHQRWLRDRAVGRRAGGETVRPNGARDGNQALGAAAKPFRGRREARKPQGHHNDDREEGGQRVRRSGRHTERRRYSEGEEEEDGAEEREMLREAEREGGGADGRLRRKRADSLRGKERTRGEAAGDTDLPIAKRLKQDRRPSAIKAATSLLHSTDDERLDREEEEGEEENAMGELAEEEVDDEDVEGEVVYDEEYLELVKRRREKSSGGPDDDFDVTAGDEEDDDYELDGEDAHLGSRGGRARVKVHRANGGYGRYAAGSSRSRRGSEGSALNRVPYALTGGEADMLEGALENRQRRKRSSSIDAQNGVRRSARSRKAIRYDVLDEPDFGSEEEEEDNGRGHRATGGQRDRGSVRRSVRLSEREEEILGEVEWMEKDGAADAEGAVNGALHGRSSGVAGGQAFRGAGGGQQEEQRGDGEGSESFDDEEDRDGDRSPLEAFEGSGAAGSRRVLREEIVGAAYA